MEQNVRDALKAVFGRMRAMPKEEFRRNLRARGNGCLSASLLEMADFMNRIATRLTSPMKIEHQSRTVDTDFAYSEAQISDAANDAQFAMAA